MAIHYMSPTGSDSNTGSISSPWFTMEQAWSAASAGDLIYMRGGTYEYNDRQDLANKSGTSGNLIRFEAYPNESPVISPSSSFSGDRAIRMENADYIKFKGFDVTGFVEEYTDHWIYSVWVVNCDNCTFEEMKVHDNAHGFYMVDDCNGNLFLNCDFYRNANPLWSADPRYGS